MANVTTNTTHRTSSRAGEPLARANVLILDANRANARRLRDSLEADFAANVEIAANIDESLDVLGNAARPIRLVMADTMTDIGACVAVLRVLIRHKAQVAVTLHGRHAPEDYAAPDNLMGAAAYITADDLDEAVPKAAEVLRLRQHVATIIADAIVPPTLDPTSAMSIYAAAPGERFVHTLRA